MMRLVVTGSECTGKSTLARALADHFGAPCVGEYVRTFVHEQGRAPQAGDVETIARGQIAVEDVSIGLATGLLVLDTDLLSTIVYSRHYYGGCPQWISTALSRRPGDLYLLAGIDVPWVADATQRDRGHRREEMQQLFRAALVRHSLAFEEVSGSLLDRLRRSLGVIGAARSGRRCITRRDEPRSSILRYSKTRTSGVSPERRRPCMKHGAHR